MVCVGYESLTVTNTAVGLASIPANQDVKAVIMAELSCGPMKFRCDGTDPTAGEGQDLIEADQLVLMGPAVATFKAIRTGANNGVLKVAYYIA